MNANKFFEIVSCDINRNPTEEITTIYKNKNIYYGNKKSFTKKQIKEGIILFWDQGSLIVSPYFSEKNKLCNFCFFNQREKAQSFKETMPFIETLDSTVIPIECLMNAINTIIHAPIERKLFSFYVINELTMKRNFFFRGTYCESCLKNKTPHIKAIIKNENERLNKIEVSSKDIRSENKNLIYLLEYPNNDSEFYVKKELLESKTISYELSFVRQSREAALSGIGTASTYRLAKKKAIFESLERFSGTASLNSKSIINTMEELKKLKKNFYNPNDWFDKTNKKKRISEHEEIYWIESYNPVKRTNYLIPEDFVIYKNNRKSQANKLVCSSSNGHAIGNTIIEASIYSMYELIERDTFLQAWYLRESPLLVIKASIKNSELQNKIRKIEENGYDLFIYDLSSDYYIPTFWVYVEGKNYNKFASYSTAATHYDNKTALESALNELDLALSYYDGHLPEIRKKSEEMKPEDIVTVADHPIYYASDRSKEYFSFLSKVETKNFSENQEEKIILNHHYTELVSRLSKRFNNIYITRNTPIGVEELGLEEVKIFIPGMHDMYFGYDNQIVNLERLGRETDELYIHPFP